MALGKLKSADNPERGTIDALATTEGKILTDHLFELNSQFYNGYASASNENATFFIDLQGRIVKESTYLQGSGVMAFVEDLISATIDKRQSYYFPNRKLVYTQNSLIPINQAIRVLEEKYKPNAGYLVYYPQMSGIEEHGQKTINEYLKQRSDLKNVSPTEDLPYTYKGDFTVLAYLKNLLIIQFTGYEYYYGVAHGLGYQGFALFNIENGDFYALKDLFKKDSDYNKKLSDIIKRKIE